MEQPEQSTCISSIIKSENNNMKGDNMLRTKDGQEISVLEDFDTTEDILLPSDPC